MPSLLVPPPAAAVGAFMPAVVAAPGLAPLGVALAAFVLVVFVALWTAGLRHHREARARGIGRAPEAARDRAIC